MSMPRLLPLLVLCLATSTAAADGFYVGESYGATRVKDEMSSYMDAALSMRLTVGYRTKQWAFEGALTGYLGFRDEFSRPFCSPEYCHAARTVTPPSRPTNDPGSDLFTYGFEVKRIAPVNRYLELYVGGGLGRAVTIHGDFAGNGLGVRAGAQLKGKVPALGFLFWPLFFTNWGPKVTAALFLDNGVDVYRLHERYGGRAIDAQLHRVSLGLAVGSDF